MNYDFTLFSIEQLEDRDRMLDIDPIFERSPDVYSAPVNNREAVISDFAILLGGQMTGRSKYINLLAYDWSMDKYDEMKRLENRTGLYWTKSVYDYEKQLAWIVDDWGQCQDADYRERIYGGRPAIQFSSIQSIATNRVSENNKIIEIEFGEYPQKAVPKDLANILDEELSRKKLSETGKTYTTDSVKYDEYNHKFKPQEHIEYEYNGKKYVRIQANTCFDDDEEFTLSNSKHYKNGDFVWIEVSPIIWYVDKQNDIAYSKNILFAGIQFNNTNDYSGNFDETNIKQFLDNCFSKDIIPSKTNINKNPNRYTFDNSKEEYGTLQTKHSR